MNKKSFLVFFTLILTIVSMFTIKISAEEDYSYFNFFNIDSDYLKDCCGIDSDNNIKNIVTFENDTNLPSKMDLSKNKYFPPVGEQEGGSCASWATTYYQLTYEINKLNETEANIPQNICSPLYTFNYLNNGDFSNGAIISKCYKVIQNLGCTTCDVLNPINNKSIEWITDSIILIDNLKYNIDYQTFTISSSEPDFNSIKTILNQNKLVVTSGYISCWNYNNVYEIGNNGKAIRTDESIITEAYYNTKYLTNGNGYHAFTIVGYDDDVWCDVNRNGKKDLGETGAFKVVNSWGSDWRNDGFIWLLYDAFRLESIIPNIEINSSGENFVRLPICCETYKNREDQYFYYIENTSINKPMIVGEVNLNTDYRNQINIKRGVSNFEDYLKINCFKEEEQDFFMKNLKFIGPIIVDFDKQYNYYKLSAYSKIFWNVQITDTLSDGNSINNITYTLKDNLGNPITETISLQSVDGDSVIGRLKPNLKKGDINYDGLIDMQDVIKLKKYLDGKEELSYLQIELADFNEDGITDEEDYNAVLNQISHTDIYINLNDLAVQTNLKFKINCPDYSYTLNYADLETKNNKKILQVDDDFDTIIIMNEDIFNDNVITSFDNIAISQLIRKKYNFNGERYVCEINMMSSSNKNVNITIDSYLDGDVTLDNEVTSYDALTVLMYVVNNYSIIQTGSTGDFNMGHGNITVNGDISSNSAINIHASNGNFNGKITAPLIQTWGTVNAQRETDLKHHVPENPFSDSQMTELFFKDITHIDSDYNNDSYAAENNGETTNININQPVSANSVTLTNNVNINNNLKANGDINISGSVQNDTRCVIYSSNGNITLNSDNFSFTGLIYAPNGTVSITGNNINITGTIIAKEVIIEGDTVNFNTNNNFFNYTNINNEYFDLIGAYLSDLQIFIADIDDDGDVTAYDAECILNKATGNI